MRIRAAGPGDAAALAAVCCERLHVDIESLGEALKWEPSRGGDLFPHLYGPLPVSAVVEARPLGLDADGVPELGPLT